MNKTLKGILGGSAVLVVLGGALVALNLTDPEKNAESSDESSADETVMLWEAETKAINKITVEPADGEAYTAVRQIDKVTSTDINGETTEMEVENYILKGYEKLPMDTTEIRTLATRSPSLAALETIAEHASAEELGRYGLDKPVKVTLSVDGQDDICFLIGAAVPVDNARYLCMNGSDTVYTVSSSAMDPFLNDPKHFLGKTLVEEQADDDNTIIDSVRIEREDLDYDIYLKYDKYYAENSNAGGLALHVMEEPVQCLLSPDKSSDVTHGMYGLTAVEALTPFPSAADKKAAGLDEPFAVVTVKTDKGKKSVFSLGKTYETEDGAKRYYGMLDGLDCIYGFDPDAIAYDNVRAEDITSKNILDAYVWDIGRLTYKAGDLVLDFEGDGESADDFVLSLNGERLESVERYRQLYTFLLEAKAEELVLEDVTPKGKPMAEVTMKGLRDVRDLELKFYEADAMKAYIEVDGQVRFMCRKTYVNTLIRNMELYADTEMDFIKTW